jgi:DNA repair protein RadA/Sms
MTAMARDKSVYTCTECGGTSAKWLGKCPACGAWNTLVEGPAESGAPAKNRFAALAGTQAVATLAEIEARDVERQPTGVDELDRVLGGGLVAGGVVLIGGDPGIGKSTLLLQALDAISRQADASASAGAASTAATGDPDAQGSRGNPATPAPAVRVKTLYVTGEESGAQVALRARRLGLDASAVRVLAEIQLEKIAAALESERPQVCVIDSIQTLYSEQLTSAPGSVAQVRECAAQLTRLAKRDGVTVVLVGHVTKEGAIAGPRVLEHIVDTVLYFEGDTHSSFRLVRAIKNRFGAVNEIGVFAMTERGLKGVSNPSAIFLSTHGEPVPGACVLVTLEGTRPLLVEVQALVDSGGPSPRRLSVGLDRDRLAMMLAVMHRHAGIDSLDQDVFVNAVGGVRIGEPAADLAVMLAIQSSLRGKPLPRGFVAFGEVGLAGEVRPAPRGLDRLKEAAKLGFSVALIPKANAPRGSALRALEGLELIAVERIEQAIDAVRGRG